MVGDFQWQENLKTLCEYVASKIWFNLCSALPNSLVAIVKKHRNYGRYFSFKKKRVIRKIAKSVCKYLKLNFNYINLEIDRYSDRFTGYLGSFRANSVVGADIYVSYSSQFSIYRQAAVIVHELTHYFAYLNDIAFEVETEKCTDVLSLFLGFYPILCNGYAIETCGSDKLFGEKKSMIAGYLSDEELRYCYTVISAM